MRSNSHLFNISFRPFFILAALIAFINPLVWVLSYLGHLPLPLNLVDPLFWHGHEMLFGFSGALIAGFILTASANWTSSEPYKGNTLIALSAVWVLERVSYFLPLNTHLQFILLNLFFPFLLLLLFLKLRNFPKQKYVFIPILLGLTLGKIFHSFEYIYEIDATELYGKEIAAGLVRFIVLLIAGRVVPFFTRKKIQGLQIVMPAWINPMALFPVALLCVPWIGGLSKSLLASILLAAALTNIARQIMWKPLKTIKVPILFILHIGILFINLGLVLEFFSLFYESFNFSLAGLHLLMAGGLGVVGIGIMTRVSLGHTGRVIEADSWTKIAYVLIIIGALLRGIIPIFFPALYFKSLYFAGGFWSLGFLIFLLRYFNVLIKPRPDGKAY